jgi:hypothetical protein
MLFWETDMMMHESDAWAQKQVGNANLGDPRRTSRLVKLAATIANAPGKKIVNIAQSPADMEGAYRFIRNDHIQASAIADAGFQVTAELATQHHLLLALEDTTTITYTHKSIRNELGYSSKKTFKHAMFAHSTLMFAPETKDIVGLIAQHRWIRTVKKEEPNKPYKDKESYRWESASQQMSTLLGSHMQNVISVCDKEADAWEYLYYKLTNQQRFVVRSRHSRCIEDDHNHLYEYTSGLQSAGKKSIYIPQRGGKHPRKARTAIADITFTQVTLKVPQKKEGEPSTVWYVGCAERDNPDSDLNWQLLTTEPVRSKEEALKIIEYYEYRWLVEEYHKVWKSEGTDIEELQLQSRDNMERMVTIMGFVATRLLQLKFANKQSEDMSCEKVLSPRAWKLLWLKREGTAFPQTTPNMKWAYENLARLGGWKDTKRTGQASNSVLWQGWFKLQAILEGYELAKELETLDPDL